jgi:hypothetical protein
MGGMKWQWIPAIAITVAGGLLCMAASAAKNEWLFLAGFLLAGAGSGWMHWLRWRAQPPAPDPNPAEVDQAKRWRPWGALALFACLLALSVAFILGDFDFQFAGYLMAVLASLGIITCLWQFVAVWGRLP